MVALLLLMAACSNSTPTPATINATVSVPTIGFVPSQPHIGDKLTIKGSGFPAKGQIAIVAELVSIGNSVYITPDRLNINAVADETGKFITELTMDKWVTGKPYQVGSKLRFTVSTVEKDPAIELSATIVVIQAVEK
jgi:hypothetical protein